MAKSKTGSDWAIDRIASLEATVERLRKQNLVLKQGNATLLRDNVFLAGRIAKLTGVPVETITIDPTCNPRFNEGYRSVAYNALINSVSRPLTGDEIGSPSNASDANRRQQS